VADRGAGTIVRVDPRVAPAAATVLARPGRPADPRGLALAADGSLYVALLGFGSVARLTPEGALLPVVEGLDRPVAVGVEPDCQLLILEQGPVPRGGRLLRVDPARPQDRRAVATGLDRPTALAVAADGRAYVSLDGGDGPG